MIRAIRGSRESDVHGISPFQALCTSLASRVGTGNLAGVAVALYLGGAGAIFWMWMVALVGMATGYAESTLAQLYKQRDGKGQYRGGPAVYIAKGLGSPWAGGIFAVCLILSFGLVFNAVQANSIADAMQGAFGIPKLWVGGSGSRTGRGRDLRRLALDCALRRAGGAVHGRYLHSDRPWHHGGQLRPGG